MKRLLSILHLEDSAEDAFLIKEMLACDKIEPKIKHVSNRQQYSHALENDTFDIILSDHSLPDFDGTRALLLAREKAPETPFILISGEMGEELAIHTLQQGATDYVLKQRLQRLVPAVLRSIDEAENKRKKSEMELMLKKSQERYELAAQGSNDGLWDWDLEKNEIYFSKRWKSIIGYDNDEFPNSVDAWLSHLHPDEQLHFEYDLNLHLQAKKTHLESYHRLKHKDGSYRWVLLRGLAVRNLQGKPYRLAGSMTDVTQRKQEEDELIYNAYHDKLTGLSNRSFFINYVQRIIFNYERKKSLHSAILFMDMDRFKIINDSMGHYTGDLLLIEIANRLKSVLRTSDIAARLGGDEFSVILNELKSREDILQATTRILEQINGSYTINQETFYITVSIGIAFFHSGYKRAEDLLRDADTAMYYAKSKGKSQFQIFNENMHLKMLKMFHLEKELRNAVLNKSFSLFYQPIVRAPDCSIVGFEALLRWNHPQKGYISPVDFIPLAEELGLIIPLGNWVLETACAQLKKWLDSGMHDVYMSINCSLKQFQNPDFASQVISIISQQMLPPSKIFLEITESILMGNEKTVLENITEIVNAGVLLSIDDFGTGYSCLACLNKFPIHTLKIDRSFIKQIESKNDHILLIKAILAMAENLGMSAIAEGVENEQQKIFLENNNCQFYQGFYFSQPKPVEELDNFNIINII